MSEEAIWKQGGNSTLIAIGVKFQKDGIAPTAGKSGKK